MRLSRKFPPRNAALLYCEDGAACRRQAASREAHQASVSERPDDTLRMSATRPDETALPRIALFLSDPVLLHEIEEILRNQYSSLLLITEKEKIKEFRVPLIVVVDAVKAVSDILALGPAEGTRILVVLREEDGEEISAAFDVGAADCITHPFEKEKLVEKTEKYLEAFRQNA